MIKQKRNKKIYEYRSKLYYLYDEKVLYYPQVISGVIL
jgi:hypothetical protein